MSLETLSYVLKNGTPLGLLPKGAASGKFFFREGAENLLTILGLSR
jgi:hypothetical protein